MNQKQIESQLKFHLLASGPDKIWRLEDLRLLLKDQDDGPSKRTLERWI